MFRARLLLERRATRALLDLRDVVAHTRHFGTTWKQCGAVWVLLCGMRSGWRVAGEWVGVWGFRPAAGVSGWVRKMALLGPKWGGLAKKLNRGTGGSAGHYVA
jgi:hypothetical protein